MHVTDSKGVQWQVYEQRVNGLINRHAFSYAFKQHSKIARTKDHWLQSLKLAPGHGDVETDWRAVEAKKKEIAAHNLKVFSSDLAADGTKATADLVMWLRELRQLECSRNNLFSDANAINTNNQEWADSAIKIAQTTRDTSFMAVGVIAAVSTGGVTFYVATAVTSAGSGASKYQDLRMAGASTTTAAWKAVGTAGLTAIPLGVGRFASAAPVAAALGSRGAVALTVVVDGSVEFTRAVTIDDAELGVAVTRALTSAAFTGASEAAKGQITNWVGRNLRGAATVLDQSADGIRLHNRTPSLAYGLASSLAQSKSVDGAKGLHASNGTPQLAATNPSPGSIMTMAGAQYGRPADQCYAAPQPIVLNSPPGLPPDVCLPVSDSELYREISTHRLRRLN